ncbi:YckD family protein [Alkalihalobacillus sp. BA299]|uniref:YckD family protein n=1 Tax=Alkalihalobacillus sp. BA299 TaxID=2815938 RepID=UPI001ADC35E9|nr:YckD family protein [Alkalihalobacillus sp. BA299]
MKKVSIAVLSALFLSMASLSPISVQAEFDEKQAEMQNVELTQEQKDEISVLHKDVLEKKKEVILKYVEYGVFSEEKGNEIISKFEKRYAKLEENGFIPKWDHKKKSIN